MTEDKRICIRVLNAVQACISWQEGPVSQQEELLAQAKARFSGDDFTFVVTDTPPEIPAGGYNEREAAARRIRFKKNVT